METSPRAKQHFAKQHVNNAIENQNAVYKRLVDDAEENRHSYEKFYASLAIFSGSTIALSITYLGYLRNLATPTIGQGWLIASWIGFVLCVASSLLWPLLNAHYMHFGRQGEYAKAIKERYEAEIEEIPRLNLANLQTPTEMDEFINPRRKVVAGREEDTRWNQKREKAYFFLRTWAGRIAHLSFFAGLLLLLIFTLKNM